MEKLNYNIKFKRGIYGKDNRDFQKDNVNCDCSECEKDFKEGDEYWYPLIISTWFNASSFWKPFGAYPMLSISHHGSRTELDIDSTYVICKKCKDKRLTKLGGRNSSQA
jgi:hypothetical protein